MCFVKIMMDHILTRILKFRTFAPSKTSLPATHTYSPIPHAPATVRAQLASPCRYPRYAEPQTSSVPDGGSVKRCTFRGMTVVSHTEAKGKHRGNGTATTGGRNLGELL